jgi:uncharacterized protein YigE (DUF2233 family)
MAVGDVVSAIVSASSGGRVSIQPAAGVEWVIHNVWAGSTVASFDLEFFDGANVLTALSSQTGPIIVSNLQLHANNAVYPRILNNDSGTRLFAYDGVQTK